KALKANPSMSGFAAAFTSPMTITGGAKIYSIYTSQAVFNGEVVVKISTDGKILVIGKLNFADGNISISGRLYADLSKVASGDVAPKAMVAVTTATGVELRELVLDTNATIGAKTGIHAIRLGVGGEIIISTEDFEGGATDPQLLLTAIDKTGTRTFRYMLTSGL